MKNKRPKSKPKPKPKPKSKSKINYKVISYSLIALGFLALTYFVDWMFIIGAVIMVWLNQRELMKKKIEKR